MSFIVNHNEFFYNSVLSFVSDAKSLNLRKTYGLMDMEKQNLEGTGWFTIDPAEAARFTSSQWQTADYRAGDVIIFTMKTIHMSTTNTTDKV